MKKISRTTLEISSTIWELFFGGGRILVSHEVIEEDNSALGDEGQIIDVSVEPPKAIENK